MATILPALAVNLAKNLENGTAECVICTEGITRGQALWSCRRCYGILHLPCIIFWAENRDHGQASGPSAQAPATLSSEFRCPLCQSAAPKDALEDRCFCGQMSPPPIDPSLVPGTCGQTCHRSRPDPNCPHRCAAQCHPGPCPPCGHNRDQACYCGADERVVGCSSGEAEYSCGADCGKELSCGRHYCEQACHPGSCHKCAVVVELSCWCGQHSKQVTCSRDGGYSCGTACGKKLDCGKHTCLATCHDGPCAPCLRTPARQTTCACGKVPAAALAGDGRAERTSCTDPLPTCGNTCDMPLPCGQHTCASKCHDGPCPPCTRMVEMPCRCGKSAGTHPCFTSYVQLPFRPDHGPTDTAAGDDDDWDEDNPDIYDKQPWFDICERHNVNRKTLPKLYPPRCPRKCNAKKLCAKHSCHRTCCGDKDHICGVICRKRAPCGIHECGQLCHRGPCPPCDHVSFDPLFCRCRRSVVDPPVPCNTPPPRCNHPCILPRPCGHPANHTCHQGECPPCVVPVPKTCGSHGKPWEYHLPCSRAAPSCGKTCGKALLCCLSTCHLVCHAGECAHKCTGSFNARVADLKRK